MSLFRRLLKLESRTVTTEQHRPAATYYTRPGDSEGQRQLARRAAALLYEQQHGFSPQGGEFAFIEIEEHE